MGGLLPVVSAEKNGIMTKEQFIETIIIRNFSNSFIYKIANIARSYTAIMITGVEIVYVTKVEIIVCRTASSIYAIGNMITGLSLKVDSISNIYISMVTGRTISCRIFALDSGVALPTTKVDSFPQDAKDITIKQ